MNNNSKDKKITIGLFNDSFYPMVDGVISVLDNYARRLNKIANVIVFVPKTVNQSYDDTTLPYKVVRCKSFKMYIIDYSCPAPIFDKNFKKISFIINLRFIFQEKVLNMQKNRRYQLLERCIVNLSKI